MALLPVLLLGKPKLLLLPALDPEKSLLPRLKLNFGIADDDDFKVLVLQKFVFKPFENASLYLSVPISIPVSKEKGLPLVAFGWVLVLVCCIHRS